MSKFQRRKTDSLACLPSLGFGSSPSLPKPSRRDRYRSSPSLSSSARPGIVALLGAVCCSFNFFIGSCCMAGLKQLKRVSWARELNQVRLFLAEDAPALSGLGAQDNLQAKGSWLLHSSSISNDDSSLPPGFESPHPAYQLRSQVTQIPLAEWKCPLRILLSPKWLVAAGAESEEIAIQNQRQMRVLEAIYPRSTSVPPNPSVSSEVQDSFCDDSQTLTIPITAVEDEDPSEQLETGSSLGQFQRTSAQNIQQYDIPAHTSATEHSHGDALQSALAMAQGDTAAARILGSTEPDVVAAASAAFTAIMKSNEQGNMIDRDLLITILTNPSLVGKLVSEYGTAKESQPALASSSISFSHPSHLVQPPAHPPSVPPSGIPSISNRAPPLPGYRTPQMYPLPSSLPPPVMHAHTVPSLPVPSIPLKPMQSAQAVIRDANYLKSLVQQHGGEKPDAVMVAGNVVDLVNYGPSHVREVRPKIPRPCAFFNTPKGCWHGANCSYQHDGSLPPRTEQPRGPKRIKLDGGIVNRN
ncbi:zinc finger CCCH domain-containing protein 30-like [Zingiber officinale]|uniref:C3H1-type domain-containing protein n=1 Tax=Zingiber officinale TaxID=94328 RepID=A0A8J5G1T2_ZINOF|nr:zinc finger CCCH domain-containing protein 30-like [Zingiber officinale]KAG6498885.1 hypothetical protein ZIOFF_038635 [Zingiber officinale]